jgi:hypothetical protein
MRPTLAVLFLLTSGCEFSVEPLPIGGLDDGAATDSSTCSCADLGPDQAQLPPDFAGADLRGVDLSTPPDLSTPADLSTPPDFTTPVDFSTPPDLTGVPPGQLMGMFQNQGNADVNLTGEGSSDWAHWGTNGMAAAFDHKLTGSTQISNFSLVNNSSAPQTNTYMVTSSWTDGTPTMMGNKENHGVYIYNVGQGFILTAPADTNQRTLKIYCGGQQSMGTVVAHLSDGSAADYTATGGDNMKLYQKVITLQYKSGTAGQTLTVTWSVQNGSFVHLLSATLH